MPHAEDAENAEGRRDLGARSAQVGRPEFTMEVYETANQDLNLVVLFLGNIAFILCGPLRSLLPLRLILAA
jgi:hypothetical protein